MFLSKKKVSCLYNNNNNNHDDIYSAVINRAIARVHSVHAINTEI